MYEGYNHTVCLQSKWLEDLAKANTCSFSNSASWLDGSHDRDSIALAKRGVTCMVFRVPGESLSLGVWLNPAMMAQESGESCERWVVCTRLCQEEQYLTKNGRSCLPEER